MGEVVSLHRPPPALPAPRIVLYPEPEGRWVVAQVSQSTFEVLSRCAYEDIAIGCAEVVSRRQGLPWTRAELAHG